MTTTAATENGPHPTHIVGIGASAGGLAALGAFFEAVHADNGMAFVVVQHLSPDFKSLMNDLLARHTSMKIFRGENDMVLQPNCVYLIPPKCLMTVANRRLYLHERELTQHLNLPIDVFFQSLAIEAKDHAIAVILSGTGSDGSRGIQAVHDQGGLVIAQSLETAQFDGMPRTAINTGLCHHILAPEEMPAVMEEFAKEPHSIRLDQSDLPDLEEGEYAEILSLLRRRYSLDFTKYKPTTINRRILRRMDFARMRSKNDYIELLSSNVKELDTLYQDLLIGVTEFFRNPKAFDFLQSEALPSLFAPGRTDDVRVWVAGCATGEEAYSIAIVLKEAAAQQHFDGKITIFATDVHKSSLETAGLGSYPAEQLANIPPEFVDRYFTKDEGDRLRVNADLRKMVIFAPQNLLNDPPFTKIDLVCCRNLLIYFLSESQERVIALFNFALRPGGLLFLGSSESLGRYSEQFATVNASYKIFRKIHEIHFPATFPDRIPKVSPAGSGMLFPSATRNSTMVDRQLLHAYDQLLERHVPAGILINEQRQVLHFFGDAIRYLKPFHGRMETDILRLAEGELHLALSIGLQRAIREHQTATIANILIAKDSTEVRCDLIIECLPAEKKETYHYFISFRPIHTPIALPLDRITPEAVGTELETVRILQRHIADLELDLQSAKENLQASIEELQTSNEELQATNEELLAANEELQSTNEELQATNEELFTVNAEFEKKNEDLLTLNRDHDYLLSSLEEGVVFVDDELRIRKYNPASAFSFKLMPQDIGRPIDHIAYQLADQEQMLKDVTAVLTTGTKLEKQVQSHEGQWLVQRIFPFRGESNRVKGVILTFIDINKFKAADITLLRGAESRYRHLVTLMPEVMYKMSPEGRFMEADDALVEILGFRTKAELFAADPQKHLLIEGKSWNHSLKWDGKEFLGILPVQRKDGSRIWIELRERPVLDAEKRPLYREGLLRDVTQLVHTREENEELHQQLLRSQKMETVGFLASGVAHDFNNILNNILGTATLLRDLPYNPEKSARWVKMIIDSVGRGGQLVKQLLATAKQTTLTKSRTDINALVAESVQLMQETFPTNITIDAQYAGSLPPIEIDPSMIHQVLLNIGINARDAMPDGGTLTVTTALRTRSAMPASHGVCEHETYVEIAMRDTGVGMSSQMLQQIFEPFYTTKPRGLGTGLGLSVSLGIVHNHHGLIHVGSELNKGTEFRIFLPVTETALGDDHFPAEVSTDDLHGNETLLIVEDEQYALHSLAEYFGSRGYTVLTADTGASALEQFHRHSSTIGLVLSDYGLPDLNGSSLFYECKKSDPSVRFIILTGLIEQMRETDLRKDGVLHILTKPYHFSQIHRVIRGVLDTGGKE